MKLPELLRDAMVEAKAKTKLLMLIETEAGLFRLLPGSAPWTTRTRAYITARGEVVTSEAATRAGFKLPTFAPA